MTQRPRRIGVFGGAFDPPHNAHLALARAALEQLELDELRVLPTGQAWHKPRVLSAAAHRVAMARLAFAEVARACVDERETLRAGPSFTVDTLTQLQGEHAGAVLYLLLGQDQAQALPSWHRWQEILGLAIICVATRDADASHGDAPDLQRQFSDMPQGRFLTLRLAPMAVASTQIRSLVAAAQDIAPLVPQAVARYISTHHLYQNS